MTKEYDFKKISDEVAEIVQERNDYFCDHHNTDKKKFYALGMFAYPSGNAHMGHVRVYTLVDVVSRFKKLTGYQVLNPIGWDAFGLPAENAAIKQNVSPDTWTKKNIHTMKTQQFNRLGCSFDWDKEITTCHPDYYRWTQWLFLKFYEHGKAYKKKELVNWCPTDHTVLANEQVIDGKCWRDNTPVEKRYMEQWFLKITDYADLLWEDIKKLKNWPNEAIAMQKNWIKKSEGAVVTFDINEITSSIEVFTTRVDTLFGVTALVLAPEHPLINELQGIHYCEKLENYRQAALKKSQIDRAANKEKTGIQLNFTATHPSTQAKIPIYVAEYVNGNFGTGALMCVPCHDERDYEFAQKHNLNMIPVIQAKNEEPTTNVYTGDGTLINSNPFNGLANQDAAKEILAYLITIGKGKSYTAFNLHDWSISRQRYWGCPIPIILCPRCGNVPVQEENLPVLLPPVSTFTNGKAEYPTEYIHTTCPHCHGAAQRETDTLDTFICSAWYALRFTDSKNKQAPFSSEVANHWMPIDFYVGGLEHAAQHMLYFRFFTKFLNDIGLLAVDEPVDNFFCNGMVLKDGSKMSKSKGNVVLPSDVIDEFGSDSLRLYILGDTPAHLDIDWDGRGIEAKHNFLKKIFQAISHFLNQAPVDLKNTQEISNKESANFIQFYEYISRIEQLLERYEFHNVIARWHELSNLLLKLLAVPDHLPNQDLQHLIKDYLITSSVVIPTMTEWLYYHYFKKTGIYHEKWPDHAWVNAARTQVTIVIQINGKKINTINAKKNITQQELEILLEKDEKIISTLKNYVIKNKIFVQNRIFNYIGSKQSA